MDVPAYYKRSWHLVYDSLLAERFDSYQGRVFNLFGLARSSGGVDAYFEEVIGLANPIRGEKAIDVCCGTGTLALKMRDRIGVEGEVWGVDLSRRLLEVAQKKDVLGRINFIQANAQQIPIASSRFDIATVTTSLHEMYHPDRLKILKELYRILKPEGRLVVGEQRQHPNRILRALWWIFIAPFCMPELRTLRDMYRYSLEEEVREAGFEFIREVPTNWGFMRVILAERPD